MRAWVAWAWVVVAWACGGWCLEPPARPYDILVLLPVSTQSHRNVVRPLIQALAARGHKVTVLSNLPPMGVGGVVEVDHGVRDFQHAHGDMFEDRRAPLAAFDRFRTLFVPMVEKLYTNPAVLELYGRRKEFDLIIIDSALNEVAYPFLHEMPFITVSTPPGVDWRQSAVLGNVLNPSYANSLLREDPVPMTFLQRLGNALVQVVFAFLWRHWDVVPGIQKEISVRFPHLPPLLDIERNMSLSLMNTHHSTNAPLPLLPNQVEVGSMHCRPPQPLPKELEDWISGAGEAGVVYFSLGSVAKGTSMPAEYRAFLVQAFARLPQRVVWKFEGEVEGLSDNVLLREWLPQQDILGHPNVRVFMSHCGGLSMQEALYHATPILALPIFGDQPRNAMYITSQRFGEALVWEDLSVELVVDTVKKIVGDPRYQTSISEASAATQDRPEHPVDRAVYWTEYVIRHRGAPRIRTTAANLSWREYLMLDVLVAMQVVVYVVYRVVKLLLCLVVRKIFGGKSKTKRD